MVTLYVPGLASVGVGDTIGAEESIDTGARVCDRDGATVSARDGAGDGDGAEVGIDCTSRSPEISTVHAWS